MKFYELTIIYYVMEGGECKANVTETRKGTSRRLQRKLA